MTRMTGPDCAVTCNLINLHTYIHTYIHMIPPWEDQCGWYRMTRMTGPDCAVMFVQFNKYTCIHTYIYTYIHTDCAVMCNLINIHTYMIPPWEDQRKWHRMTRMTRPDCAVMCNLINIHTYIHT